MSSVASTKTGAGAKHLAALILAVPALVALAACSDTERTAEEPAAPELEPVSFSELDGWRDDDGMAEALRAFARSCERIAGMDAKRDWGLAGRVEHWQGVCADLAFAGDPRAYFETRFQAYRVLWGDEEDGLFTGYYEPLLHGSRTPDDHYSVPLHERPSDLVSVDLSAFSEDFRGRRVGGRIEGTRLVPYADRAAIDGGAIDDVAPTFLWVDDAVEKFFLQIQGSGQVRLEDGEVIRVGYADQNGRPYRAIGRDLIEMGELTRENVSLQTIRAWLE
ncbi:MAG: MltA domain-containing protein, partial [Geminicoccaceae bacterium]|nr:MltA domain-containing protein [Geminicoccaceae bacterium]